MARTITISVIRRICRKNSPLANVSNRDIYPETRNFTPFPAPLNSDFPEKHKNFKSPASHGSWNFSCPQITQMSSETIYFSMSGYRMEYRRVWYK